MNLVDFDKASAAAKQSITELQAAGMTITDEEAKDLHDAIHGALTEASTDVSVAIKPLLEALADLQITVNTSVGVLVAESAAWRGTVAQVFNLHSPPGGMPARRD